MADARRKRRRDGDGEMLEPDVPSKRNNVILHQEFDTQDTMPINAQVQATDTEYIYPEQTAYATLNQFSINVIGRDQEWMDPSSLKVFLKVKVTKPNGDALEDYNAEVMPEPFFPATLFQSIKVEVNGNTVPVSSYGPWRNFIGKLTTMSKQAARNMEAEGFAPFGEGHDKFSIHEEPNLGPRELYHPKARADVIGNNAGDMDAALLVNKLKYPGWYTYNTWLGTSPEMNFILPIETDLTEQGKMFPPGKNVRFIFDRASSVWTSLRAAAAKEAKVVIVEAKLAVKFYKLEPTEHIAQLRTLAQAGTAKYPIIRKIINTPTIQRGNSLVLTDILLGKIPRRVFIAFIKNENMSGNKGHSAYLMENINLKELYITFDGVHYPKKHYHTNFRGALADRIKKKTNIIAYDQFKEATFNSSVIEPYLSYEMWEAGHTLFAFDMTPDQNASNGTHYTPVTRQGHVNLHIETAQPINDTFSVVVYSEVNQIFEIRQSDGQIIVDY